MIIKMKLGDIKDTYPHDWADLLRLNPYCINEGQADRDDWFDVEVKSVEY